MTVSCTNYHACQYSKVYCPSDAECNIACIDGNYACYNANIYVGNGEYSGLDLDCDEEDSTTCSEADIICSDSGLSNPLSYDSTAGYFKCGSFTCCPFDDYQAVHTCSSGHCKVVFIKYLNQIIWLICLLILILYSDQLSNR